MKKFLIAIVFLFPLLSPANSLQDAVALIEQGNANLSDLVIKLKDPRKGLARARSLSLRPLFQNLRNAGELNRYRQAGFPQDLAPEKAIALLRELYKDANVETALFMPKMEDAVMPLPAGNAPRVSFADTDDYEPLQNYLQAAPVGIDAYHAWELPGGAGKNIKIIDIETGWGKHEELSDPFWDFASTTTDHGTAVLGELLGKRDGLGTTGIVHEATWGFISREYHKPTTVYHDNVAVNISKAVEQLSAGDLLVLEMHSPGPAGKFIPVEYWQPVFDIVKLASEKGILCVAAAGNGTENLDSPTYKDAFNLQNRDSGCVLVGASTNVPDASQSHVPAYFTNYGSRVDVHAYGENVVTSGYGDLHQGPDYTAEFSGTSSATPIVGGAMAAVSGMAKSKGVALSPRALREALRATGTPQNGLAEKRIGNMPDLKALTATLGLN